MLYILIMQSLEGVAPWVWHSSVWVRHLAPVEPSIHHHMSIVGFLLAPQEDMPPLAISWNVKMAPGGFHAWVVGLRCPSLPEILVCSADPAAAKQPLVTATWGASPEWQRIGHGALYLTVWRNQEGGILSSPFQELAANCLMTFVQVKKSPVIVQVGFGFQTGK